MHWGLCMHGASHLHQRSCVHRGSHMCLGSHTCQVPAGHPCPRRGWHRAQAEPCLQAGSPPAAPRLCPGCAQPGRSCFSVNRGVPSAPASPP